MVSGESKGQDLLLIVDDDEAVRLSTGQLLERAGYRVLLFVNGDEFLASSITEPVSCILLDLQMAGNDGLAVLGVLHERDESPPVIVLTAHGNIAWAVDAMRLGAHDFIEKPYRQVDLLRAVESALETRSQTQKARIGRSEALSLVATLTRRQGQVLHGIVKGMPNKIIAFELGLSIRTIEAYRLQLLAKLKVQGTAAAVRVALAAGMGEEGFGSEDGLGGGSTQTNRHEANEP